MSEPKDVHPALKSVDTTTVHSVAEALQHMDKRTASVTEAINLYNRNVKDLTGHDPQKPVGPLDVVKIVQKVFGL